MDYVSLTDQQILYITIGFYVLSLTSLVLRLLSMAWSSRSLRCDDLVMPLIFVIYTTFMVSINTSRHFQTNLFPSEQRASILSNQTDVHDRVIGSLVVVLLEQSMLLTLWAIKLCILGFVHPLMKQMPRGHLILKLTAGYIIACFVAIEIAYFGVLCTPFRGYWTVPVDNPQCASYETYFKIQLAFNTTSYFLIMAISIAITSYVQLPMDRKLIVFILLCIGVFIFIAAIFSKLYKLISPEDPLYALWYIIEISLAMWTANVICCWPLIQKLSHCRSFDNSRSFYVVREHNLGREHSEPSRSRESSWWSNLLSLLKRRRVDGTTDSDHEMNNRAGTVISGARHATSASRDTTVMMHAELAAYLESDPITPHGQSLTRDNDTSPALAYREVHKID